MPLFGGIEDELVCFCEFIVYLSYEGDYWGVAYLSAHFWLSLCVGACWVVQIHHLCLHMGGTCGGWLVSSVIYATDLLFSPRAPVRLSVCVKHALGGQTYPLDH